MSNSSITYIQSNSTLAYLVPFCKRHYYIYTFILVLVIAAVAILPLVSVTISTSAQGITRPASERTHVKNMVADIIDKIYYKEGDTITKDAVLLRIKDEVSQLSTAVTNLFHHFRKNTIYNTLPGI